MRFFHLSDLHIGLKLINHDLYEDQEYILGQAADYAEREKPDAVVIAGDIYDKSVPSAEAVGLFDRFITRLAEAIPAAQIMMISGNHDSGMRLNLYRSVLERHRIHMIGLPPRRQDERIEKVVMHDEYGPVNFYLLPFVRPSMVKEITGTDESGNNYSYDAVLHQLIERENVDTSERNVLVSHQFYLPSGMDPDNVERMSSEIRTAGNIDEVGADVLENFDYAALGHIHKPMKVGSEYYRYCGTPLCCSVDEAGQQKAILDVHLGEKRDGHTQIEVDSLPLKPLRQVKVIRGTLSEVLKQACEDYVTVILTDKTDLDVFDMQDRLRSAFPCLLEIRREVLSKADYHADLAPQEEKSALELCEAFLGNDLDEQDREILRDVLNTVEEGV